MTDETGSPLATRGHLRRHDRDRRARRAPTRRQGRGHEARQGYVHNGQALTVLWDVDLTLAPGDMVAVVGASGVGKSTLLQILGTLDLPTSGSIRFDGEELTR